MSADEALHAGTTLGRYELVRQVGSGGMASVWEAKHVGLKKQVAIKVLHAAVATDSEAMMRFVREGEAASRVRHPNAVDVSDVAGHNGVAYMVMEYLDGETLTARLAKGGPLEPARIAEIMLPVIAAVSAAHRVGVIHRDLKPDNVFLAQTHDGVIQPKVLDFGISKITNPTNLADGQTGTGAVLGTPQYMSPEQVKSSKHVGVTGDVYALGVILYECATARPAFPGRTLFAVLQAVAVGEYAAPSKVNPAVPRAFEALIMRAMSLSPDARPQTAVELGRELLEFGDAATRAVWGPVFAQPAGAASAPATTGKTAPSNTRDEAPASTDSQRPTPASSRPPLAVLLIALALVVAVITVAMQSFRH